MKKVYVRAHYRSLPRKSRKNRFDGLFFRIVGFGIPISALVYFLSRVPLQVYFAIVAGIATLLICGLLLFASIKIYQIQQKKRRAVEDQEYMRQMEIQRQQQQISSQDDRQQTQTPFREQEDHFWAVASIIGAVQARSTSFSAYQVSPISIFSRPCDLRHALESRRE
jgi:hypothetical protein